VDVNYPNFVDYGSGTDGGIVFKNAANASGT
jgi:hypothetical protein